MVKKIVIIAGPNGAGKTTFARSFLPQEETGLRFINADLIAAGLSPFSPEKMAVRAGRLMLEEIAACVAHGESFSFETTLSGLSWQRHIQDWRHAGYRIILYFLSLPCEELAILRVAERVRQGGHFIDESVIRRRFRSGLHNFEHYYCHCANKWGLYDNSAGTPVLLKSGENP